MASLGNYRVLVSTLAVELQISWFTKHYKSHLHCLSTNYPSVSHLNSQCCFLMSVVSNKSKTFIPLDSDLLNNPSPQCVELTMEFSLCYLTPNKICGEMPSYLSRKVRWKITTEINDNTTHHSDQRNFSETSLINRKGIKNLRVKYIIAPWAMLQCQFTCLNIKTRHFNPLIFN